MTSRLRDIYFMYVHTLYDNGFNKEVPPPSISLHHHGHFSRVHKTKHGGGGQTSLLNPLSGRLGGGERVPLHEI